MQAITGFNHLKYHQVKTKTTKEKRRFTIREAICRVCDDEAETFWHLATDCEPLQRKMRFKINPIEGWRVSQLLEVLQDPKIAELMAPPPETDQE